MSHRNFPQNKMFGFHLMPVRLDAKITIGASGAPTIVSALGIASITRLVAGVYQIRLQDNYNSLLNFNAEFVAPVTGSAVAGGSFVAGTVYQIVTLGTTTQAQWVTAGVPSTITAAPGVVFKAADIGAGNGTVKALGISAITKSELIGDQNLMLNSQPVASLQGGYINFQTLAPTDATTTTLIPTDPASGSVMNLEIIMNNSGVR